MSWLSVFLKKVTLKDVAHVVDTLAPGFVNELETYLGTPEARGRTARNLIISFARARKVPIADWEVDVLLAIVTPLAKKLKLQLR